MKTTIDISDNLFREMKRFAAEQGTSMKTVIEKAVRQMLTAPKSRKGQFRLRKHPFNGQGLQEGLTEGNWSEIRSRIYEGRGA